MNELTVELAPSAFYADRVLSEAECEDWIRRTEARGYTPAPVSTAAGAVMMTDVRNNSRVMFDDPDSATDLFERIHPLIPARWRVVELGDRTWTCIGLNERLRFYRYEPGESFALHRDGHFQRSEDERSLLTLLIYLNTPDDGGATNVVTLDDVVTVAPRPGRALLFAHRLLHEGEEVRAGTKYVLRSDVMFRRD